MTEELAKKRFFILNLTRLGGLLLVFLAIAIIAQKIKIDPVIGYVLLVVGAIDYFVAPVLFKRAWRDADK